MPLVRGNSAIYGTDDGRIVYHNLDVGLMYDAYRIGAPITHSPIPAGPSAVVVITQTGRINLLDTNVNTRYWERGVLDPIEAKPAMGESGLFVAGIDQSVWAFRLVDGRQMWRERFQSPLTDDPKLIDNVLYQAVPNEGLTAINATTGQRIWQNPEVEGGTVITRIHSRELIVWDRDNGSDAYGSTFYRVDQRSGAVLGKVHTKWIYHADATSVDDGDIYGLSRAGRIIKLVP